MYIILSDSNKWFKVYKKLDKEEKYQYVLETLDCEIPVKFFKSTLILQVLSLTRLNI